MSWLADLVPDPNNKLPLNTQTFVSILLPLIVSYYVTAVLVMLPGTLPYRLAILPTTLSLIFRALTSIDVVDSDPGYGYLGYGFGVVLIAIGMRATEWSFVREPLKRLPINELSTFQIHGHANGTGATNGRANGDAKPTEKDMPNILWDAFDLLFNMRGHGWNWERSLSATRPTSSATAFLISTLLSAFNHFLIFDCAVNTILWFSPSTFGSPKGGTIYDTSLSGFLCYARSTFITWVCGMVIYSSLQLAYDVFTIVGVLILRQNPTQWPPIFDSPWYSTSLTECWSKRWHQIFRGPFIAIGAKPLSFLFGRAGGVMGAFFWSAVLHDWGLLGTGRGNEFWSVGGYFLLMGVGCIMEALFKKVTGMKVGGWAGWLWTMSWVVGWANLFVDAYARKGLLGSKLHQESMPTQILLTHIYRFLNAL